MASDATVTAAEIARIAGVGRAAVSNWRRRHGDFPQPVGGTATSPTFSLAAVEEWLRDQGKLEEVAPCDRLWQQIRALSPDAELAATIGAVGLCLLVVARDARRDRTGGPPHGETADLGRKASALGEGLPGGRPDFDLVDSSSAKVVQAVLEYAADEGPAETFEMLFGRFLEAHSRRVFTTPPAVSELMVSLTGVKGRTLLDPACGSGTVLATAARQGAALVLGQELDAELARLTAIRLVLADRENDIRAGDSLRCDAFPGTDVDVVICNPPFNQSDWGHAELVYDSRWSYGVPPRAESELAWLQHALSHVRPGGRVAMLMPPAVASRRAGNRIRAEFLRTGTLRMVAALPAAEVPGTALGLHLWLMERPEPGERPSSEILMVDTGGMSMPSATERIVRAWRAFGKRSADLPDACARVRTVDLLGTLTDFTPARHLNVADAEAGARFEELRRSLSELLDRLPGLLPDLHTVSSEAAPLPVISVGELARSDALTIMQAPAGLRSDGPEDAPPVLTARDVADGGPPSGRLADKVRAKDFVHTKTGDVVVVALGQGPAAMRVKEGGAVLGPHLVLLRPDSDALDPDFLAGFLRGGGMERYTRGTRSGGLRTDVRAIEIPRLPLDEQRKHAAVLRDVETFTGLLRRAADLGGRLESSVTAGLAGGRLRPRV
jgi:SAM-dependent methyltransferase